MKLQTLKFHVLAVFSLCTGVTPAATFTNCPANINLGCNPVSIPDCDPNVRATNNCGQPALLVSSYYTSDVKRYNATTGAFIDTFASGGGLNAPGGLAFGPDGNLYVSSTGPSDVKRYNGTTGAFIDTFASGGGLNAPQGVVFGPDGNLYVSSYYTSDVKRYNGTTGTFINTFVSPGSGGLNGPAGLAFGPDGNLYVNSVNSANVKRYNGTTGVFINNFASGGGLDGPTFLTFSPSAPVVTCARVDTTNGCAHTRTLTYTAIDSCHNTNTCMQLITWTVDTTPPTLTCSSNKTVPCGAAWNFDAPTAFDTCCGSNLTIIVLNTVTNGGPCPATLTRTWRATDCCSNSITCSQTVTLVDTNLPFIIQQPQSLMVTQGQTAVFSVQAGGTPPLTYRWKFNGTNISGANQNTYSITNIQTTDAGLYSVSVTNVFGSVTSAPALLSVFVYLHVWVNTNVSFTNAQAQLEARSAVVKEATEYFLRFTCWLDSSRVGEVASLGIVNAVEPVFEPVVFNFWARHVDNAINVQAAPWGLPNSFNLTGDRVRIGVWDDGTPYAAGLPHPDFGSRVELKEPFIDPAPAFPPSFHSAHVIGTLVGNGSQSPCNELAGMAPQATVEAWDFTSITPIDDQPGPLDPITEMLNARTRTETPPIVLSHNSWGYSPKASAACYLFGYYARLCGDYDKLVREHALPIFFAAGNSQLQALCSVSVLSTVMPPGFGTVTPIGTAKNVVTIGALEQDGATPAIFTSCGPTSDGRLKPDVVALGRAVISTTRTFNNTATPFFPVLGAYYDILTGTSQAAPVVSGIAALLIQQFKNLNSDTYPTPALLKAVLCNTATDCGNPRPDFKCGYGKVNAVAAATALRNQQYYEEGPSSSLSTGGEWTLPLPVPACCPELKVLIAWTDYEYTGSPDDQSTPRLINDLDLELVDPSGDTHFPWVLNPNNPSALAVNTQANHRDNVEQVVVSNPAGGTWTIRVKGHNVPKGPQKFAVTWWTNCPVVLPAPPCPPQPILGLFNTGVEADGTTLRSIDTPELHYKLTVSPAPGYPATPDVNGNFSSGLSGYNLGSWLHEGPSDLSKWITPAPFTQSALPGYYTFELEFDLPASVCTNTVEITGRWASDDVGLEIKLGGGSNGVPISIPCSAGYTYQGWTPFTIKGGYPGRNTLQFLSKNTSGPLGIRVELTGTYCNAASQIICAPDKTVCSTNWTFDPPTVTVALACCTNVTTNILSTVTNSSVPCVRITRTWAVTDSCGGSNICSQTVTVLDSNTPPCPANIVVASSSCTAVPVYYTVAAANNCCTNVIFTPPSGHLFASGTTNTVRMTTDCCGTSNSCDFTVTVICAPSARLQADTSGGKLVLNWPTYQDSRWFLQWATNIFHGDWVTDTSATNPPVEIPMTNQQMYFRLIRQ